MKYPYIYIYIMGTEAKAFYVTGYIKRGHGIVTGLLKKIVLDISGVNRCRRWQLWKIYPR